MLPRWRIREGKATESGSSSVRREGKRRQLPQKQVSSGWSHPPRRWHHSCSGVKRHELGWPFQSWLYSEQLISIHSTLPPTLPLFLWLTCSALSFRIFHTINLKVFVSLSISLFLNLWFFRFFFTFFYRFRYIFSLVLLFLLCSSLFLLTITFIPHPQKLVNRGKLQQVPPALILIHIPVTK